MGSLGFPSVHQFWLWIPFIIAWNVFLCACVWLTPHVEPPCCFQSEDVCRDQVDASLVVFSYLGAVASGSHAILFLFVKMGEQFWHLVVNTISWSLGQVFPVSMRKSIFLIWGFVSIFLWLWVGSLPHQFIQENNWNNYFSHPSITNLTSFEPVWYLMP